MSIDIKMKTPCYVVNINKVCENYNNFRSGISQTNIDGIIAYSLKANYNTAIIKALNEQEAYFEVCSEYEYDLLIKQGVQESRIIVNGNINIDKLIHYGKQSLVILDSFDQVYTWTKIAPSTQFGIRINIDYFTSDKRFTNKHSRFGIDFNSSEMICLLGDDRVRAQICCLQCHLSGNTREPSIYSDVLNQLYDIITRFQLNSIKMIDIGGGFKIGNNYWSIRDYLKELDQHYKGTQVQIIFEPGNALVYDTVSYYTRIIGEKKIGDRVIKIVDGSKIQLPSVNPSKLIRKIIGERGITLCSQMVVGSTCKESDVLFDLRNESELKIGNIIELKNVGAYSMNNVGQLILGDINTYYSSDEQDLFSFGEFTFIKLCKYSECYKKGDNNYRPINESKPASLNGLYLFMNNFGEIIYVGAAYDRCISERVKQHFVDNDSGGLRYKLLQFNISLDELNKSTLYICPLRKQKRDILFDEAKVLGNYRPKYNYL